MMPRTRLEKVVENFDRDVAAGRESISQLMELDPKAFQEGVVPVLRFCSSSGGLRCVVSLLASRDLLFPVICDPALTFDEAVLLARTALKVDSQADANLAQRLAEEAGGTLAPGAAGRMMEVLDVISEGNRIM